MRDFGPSTFDASLGSPDSAAAATGQLGVGGTGGSLEGRSAYSSWRYASARESSDSEGFPAYKALPAGRASSAATAAVSWQAAGAALAAREGNSESPAAPVMGSPPGHPSPGADADPLDRQLWSPSKRPQAAGAPPPSAASVLAVPPAVAPPGMDANSYAAGERAAFMMAFQQALPGQQALGQLFSAVDALHSRLEEEAAQWRQLQSGASRTSTQLEVVLERLEGVERCQLPALQQKWEQLATRALPEELVQVLGGLQQAVSLLAQQREQLLAERQGYSGSGGVGFGRGRLSWLLLVCAGYGQALISKADVAALFLSRKILLPPSATEDQQQSRPGRQFLSTLLFVAAVEAAYQAQHRTLHRLPAIAQTATAPAQLGLRVARAAVWSAALVLAAAQTRESCQAASDSVCGAVAAAATRLQVPAWVRALPLVQRWHQRQKEQEPGDRCSPDAASGNNCAGKSQAWSKGDGLFP